MTISLSLSTESIRNAISKLQSAGTHLNFGVNDAVEILVTEGAAIAQSAYGSMAGAVGQSSGNTGTIMSMGEANVIAEFGAGDDTIVPMFENPPDTPVFPGSYSLENAMMYYRLGKWKFGGRWYTGIPARMGLLNARDYILEHGTNIAAEVIKL